MAALAADRERAHEITDAIEQGVAAIVACRNSMRAASVTERDLAAGVTTTAAAVEFLAARQAEGWSYYKLDPAPELRG